MDSPSFWSLRNKQRSRRHEYSPHECRYRRRAAETAALAGRANRGQRADQLHWEQVRSRCITPTLGDNALGRVSLTGRIRPSIAVSRLRPAIFTLWHQCLGSRLRPERARTPSVRRHFSSDRPTTSAVKRPPSRARGSVRNTRVLSSGKVCPREERQAGANNGGVVASGRVKREFRSREARIQFPARSGSKPDPGART